MEKEIVKNIRIADGEPVDIEMRELLWEDEEEITALVKEKKINAKTGEEDIVFDVMRMQRLKYIRSICNRKVTEKELLATPRKDVMRLQRAFGKLNDIGDAEKSGPSETGLGGEPTGGAEKEQSPQ